MARSGIELSISLTPKQVKAKYIDNENLVYLTGYLTVPIMLSAN